VFKQKTITQIKRRISMSKKILIPSLSLALLLVISVPISSVNAGGKWWKRNINWRIAGTIVQNIDVTSPVPFSEPAPYSLINLTARGAPGPAKITLLSKSTQDPPEDCEECFECAEGYGFPVYFDKNDMVAIFPDQSLLFASIDDEEGGILCFGVGLETAGTTYFKVKMNVKRGTGRFERASGGVLIGEGNGYPVSPDATLAGENGTITGTIDFD
jgi:hypothetical protein